MYQEMIDQYTEMYMYRKIHKGIGDRLVNPPEEDLDDMSAIEVELEYTNEF